MALGRQLIIDNLLINKYTKHKLTIIRWSSQEFVHRLLEKPYYMFAFINSGKKRVKLKQAIELWRAWNFFSADFDMMTWLIELVDTMVKICLCLSLFFLFSVLSLFLSPWNAAILLVSWKSFYLKSNNSSFKAQSLFFSRFCTWAWRRREEKEAKLLCSRTSIWQLCQENILH